MKLVTSTGDFSWYLDTVEEKIKNLGLDSEKMVNKILELYCEKLV